MSCSFTDFSILAPRPSARQMTVISNLLASASDEEKTEVLQHPLIGEYNSRCIILLGHLS